MSCPPAWLQAHLEATGRANRDGIGRVAKPRRCRCGALILAGLDSDRCALAVAVDPVVVDPASELAAILTGRRTYTAWRTPRGYELTRRGRWEIAGRRGRPVLPEHRCGVTAAGEPLPDPRPAAAEESACPPF